jgi:hypothetical protein
VEEKQKNEKRESTLLSVNGSTFLQQARTNEYVLYQAQEPQMFGRIRVDLFLEYVPDKGWWGAMRFIGRLRIQLHLEHTTLFPTPAIALLATEEFLADERQVREVLEEMRREKQDLQTFQHVPPRPPDFDPERSFSPPLLYIQETFFTLYHLTNTEAAYRSWGQRKETEIAIDLRLTHIYWKGWQAGLRFPGSGVVLFEPAVDAFFLTPEQALEMLLAFCSEKERLHTLALQLEQTHPQDQIILRNEIEAPLPSRTTLRVNSIDFVWQKQISEGDLYQAKRAVFVRLKKVLVRLVETKRRGWLGGLQFDTIGGIYFEKESDIGFSTPEEALAAAQTFIALKDEGLRMLRVVHADRMALQCKIGRYDQIVSISTIKQQQKNLD